MEALESIRQELLAEKHRLGNIIRECDAKIIRISARMPKRSPEYNRLVAPILTAKSEAISKLGPIKAKLSALDAEQYLERATRPERKVAPQPEPVVAKPPKEPKKETEQERRIKALPELIRVARAAQRYCERSSRGARIECLEALEALDMRLPGWWR